MTLSLTPPAPASAKPEVYRWTTAEVEALIASGGLTEDQELELLDGQLYRVMPVGPRHSFATGKLNRLLTRVLSEDYTLRVQDPIRLSPDSRPQPDLYIARGPEETYSTRLPRADELLLVVEVADSTLATDREVKGSLYAVAGVPEYWIVNVTDAQLERYTQPQPDGTYGVAEVLAQADTLGHPLLGELAIGNLFGDSPAPRPSGASDTPRP